MSRKGTIIKDPPVINIINSLTEVSEQARFRRGDRSHKKWRITLFSQKDNLAMSRVCIIACNVVSIHRGSNKQTQSLGLMILE